MPRQNNDNTSNAATTDDGDNAATTDSDNAATTDGNDAATTDDDNNATAAGGGGSLAESPATTAADAPAPSTSPPVLSKSSVTPSIFDSPKVLATKKSSTGYNTGYKRPAPLYDSDDDSSQSNVMPAAVPKKQPANGKQQYYILMITIIFSMTGKRRTRKDNADEEIAVSDASVACHFTRLDESITVGTVPNMAYLCRDEYYNPLTDNHDISVIYAIIGDKDAEAEIMMFAARCKVKLLFLLAHPEIMGKKNMNAAGELRAEEMNQASRSESWVHHETMLFRYSEDTGERGIHCLLNTDVSYACHSIVLGIELNDKCHWQVDSYDKSTAHTPIKALKWMLSYYVDEGVSLDIGYGSGVLLRNCVAVRRHQKGESYAGTLLGCGLEVEKIYNFQETHNFICEDKDEDTSHLISVNISNLSIVEGDSNDSVIYSEDDDKDDSDYADENELEYLEVDATDQAAAQATIIAVISQLDHQKYRVFIQPIEEPDASVISTSSSRKQKRSSYTSHHHPMKKFAYAKKSGMGVLIAIYLCYVR